jgi:glycerol-3-phosphate acyltransferase PlsX
VAHGRFTRHGFAQAIGVAERAVREGAVERTHELLESAGALRSAPASEPAASLGSSR